MSIQPVMPSEPAGAAVREVMRPACPACGASGISRYEGLHDRWFGAAGRWRMRECTERSCGTWFLDPAPHPDDLAKLYASYYTHPESAPSPDVLGRGAFRDARLAYVAGRYGYRFDPRPPAALGLLFRLAPGRREHLDLSMMKLPASLRGRLLDVGCGSGAMVRLMSDLGWDAEGIDFDARAIEAARAAGLRASVGSVESPELRERAYAAITASHVIEHVPDPSGFLARCRNLLAPGGRLALTTPNAGSLGARWLGRRWRGLEPPRHLQIFTARSLARLARSAGFEDVRVETSARLAGTIVRESLAPEAAGDPTGRRAGTLPRLVASVFQGFERLAIPIAPAAGEEIFLSAARPRREP